MTLLLGQVFIPEASKPVTNQGLSSQEETSLITETTGSNTRHMYILRYGNDNKAEP